MKTLTLSALVPILAICFLFTSCEPDEVVPTDAVGTQTTTHNASAQVSRGSLQIDFSEPPYTEIYIVCEDKALRITDGIGKIHYTLIFNGNKVNAHNHLSITGLKLIDETTGVTYVGSWVNNSRTQYDIHDFYQSHHKHMTSVLLAAPGKDNNLMLKSNFYIKYDAEGNPTIYVDNYSVDCQK